MLRVSDETRERVLRIGREEFGGASADETVRRLVDESDPQGWSDYLADAEESSGADSPISDGWSGDSE
jgi:hypothetical protein